MMLALNSDSSLQTFGRSSELQISSREAVLDESVPPLRLSPEWYTSASPTALKLIVSKSRSWIVKRVAQAVD